VSHALGTPPTPHSSPLYGLYFHGVLGLPPYLDASARPSPRSGRSFSTLSVEPAPFLCQSLVLCLSDDRSKRFGSLRALTLDRSRRLRTPGLLALRASLANDPFQLGRGLFHFVALRSVLRPVIFPVPFSISFPRPTSSLLLFFRLPISPHSSAASFFS